MERDKAELERRLALAVEELWCDDKDFRKVLDLFKEVVSCIEVGRRLPQVEDVCEGARKRLRKTIRPHHNRGTGKPGAIQAEGMPLSPYRPALQCRAVGPAPGDVCYEPGPDSPMVSNISL